MVSDGIEIPTSKGRIIRALLGSLVFVFLGVWILVYRPEIGNAFFDNPYVKYGVAVAAIVFFGFGALYLLAKLFDKKPGLVINQFGVTDNTSAVAIGLISWNDIMGFSMIHVSGQRFLVVEVNNPDHYIQLQKNTLRRQAMKSNYSQYGTPITIAASTLRIDMKELIQTLEEKKAKFQAS